MLMPRFFLNKETLIRSIELKIFFFLLLSFVLNNALHAQGLSVIERGNLTFSDTIFPGIDETVRYTDAEAAGFELTGDPEAEVRITFQLPSDLVLDGNSLSVTFGSISAGFHTSEVGQSTATSFDPKNGLTTSLGTEGKLFIWLGGTVHPSQMQQQGTYITDIVLDVEYTSN